MERISSPNALLDVIKKHQDARDPDKVRISVCQGTGCIASGANSVMASFESTLLEKNSSVELLGTGCHGFCERGPLVVIQPEGTLYQRVKPENVNEILDKTIGNGEVITKLLYRDEAKNTYEKEQDVPFYKHQERIVFAMNGHIDPSRIEDYLAMGGYGALAKVLLNIEPEQVIHMVTKSGLRGRGGGGFPAGVKWKSCRDAEGSPKYIICNADEGD
ncbi:NAD(P)H-dependent oxidoreductase subunit E, partial [Myxococcota bacterium]|nr:NAD(P)H-dependent oxidoreductase subunit E [Myxococcota bacterium]